MKIFAAKCEDELTEKDLKELVSVLLVFVAKIKAT